MLEDHQLAEYIGRELAQALSVDSFASLYMTAEGLKDSAQLARLVWDVIQEALPNHQGDAMTQKDRQEFRLFLQQATDRQIQGVYDKEHAAGREDYAYLAIDEAYRRGILLET